MNEMLKRGAELARGCSFMGKPLESYTREELVAIAALGWDAEKRSREEIARRTDFLFSLMRA